MQTYPYTISEIEQYCIIKIIVFGDKNIQNRDSIIIAGNVLRCRNKIK